MKQRERFGYSVKEEVIRSLFIFLSPSLVIFGAYIHASKKSLAGLILAIIFGGIMAFLYLIGSLVSGPFNGYFRLLLILLPGFCAVATILLAIYWQSVSSAPSEYVPPRR